MEKLAIHGGKPVRKDKIYYGRQWITETDTENVLKTLQSDFLTCGPKTAELEQKLCQYTGAEYAVAVSNGTAALHCACIAAGIGPGDEVITTPLTFAASANCILYCGGKPVFADVNPRTYNISPESIREHITERTKAVIAVDFTGQAVEIEKIRAVCEEYHLIFIEDAAHSAGTKYRGRQVGSLADLTTFSFHPVKTITGGEGGAVLTSDEAFYQKLLLAHTHGITHNFELMEGNQQKEPWYYEQVSLGFNYRITDFQAALIISQMERLDFFKNRRREIVCRYNQAFSGMDGIILQEEIPESDTCRHLYIIQIDTERLRCTRKEFFDAMAAENVQPQVHYIPVYWFPYYQRLGYEKGICPMAERLYHRIMSIPLYPKMTDWDVESVILAVKKITDYYREQRNGMS